MVKLKLFEAFAGYGSQSLALKKYGVEFKCVGISEIDKYAVQAYEALHGPVKNYGDISKINTLCLPDFDLFTYSFPCQDISMAGKQKGLEEGSGSRSSLLWECQKIIELKRPKYLMMENVKNLVGKKHKPDFDRWLSILESLGYNNYWKVINAKNCGVPQNRERVFCVSLLKEHDNFGFHFYDDFDSGIRLKDILEDQVDEKYYLSNEKIKGLIESLEANGYKTKKDIVAIDKSIKNTRIIDNANCLTAREDRGISNRGGEGTAVLEPNKLNMVGMLNIKGNESQILRTVRTEYGKNIRKKYEAGEIKESRHNMRIHEPRKDGVSNTITTVQKDNYLLEQPQFRIRKLTPKECFKLMGVSDSDIDKIQAAGISNTQQYKMAGNSIVVDCMKFLTKINFPSENLRKNPNLDN